jgi:hypothetical protein
MVKSKASGSVYTDITGASVDIPPFPPTHPVVSTNSDALVTKLVTAAGEIYFVSVYPYISLCPSVYIPTYLLAIGSNLVSYFLTSRLPR